MAKSTGNVVLLSRSRRPRPGPAGGAARLPRAPVPAADEPDLGDAGCGRRHLAPLAGAGSRLGQRAEQADARRVLVEDHRGSRRGPGHPGGVAHAARPGEGSARSRLAPSSRRLPVPTGCSAWTWSAWSAGRGRWRNCQLEPRTYWPSGPRPASARTSPPPTGCGLNSPTWAWPWPTPPTARPGHWPLASRSRRAQ